MPSENGDRKTRLDRIERAMEMFVADHEQFREEHKELMRVQVLQKEAIDVLLKTTQAHSSQLNRQAEMLAQESENRRDKDAALDKRVENLISAIGEYISRLPPLPQSQCELV